MPRADEGADLTPYALTTTLDAKFDTSTGHDHDGSDSKSLTGLGAWVDKSASYGATLAATDGFLLVYSNNESNLAADAIALYTDANANPTTLRVAISPIGGTTRNTLSATMPVRKGDYWKVVFTGTIGTNKVWWIPLGV